MYNMSGIRNSEGKGMSRKWYWKNHKEKLKF